MLANQAQASTCTSILTPASAADTAAATSAWVSIADYEGFLAVTSQVGAVTAGSIAGKLRHADDDSGTNAADITGATFTTVTTSNDPKTEKISVAVNGLKPYIQYVGTVTTGPAVVGVSMLGTKKYV